jgi:hypothetical protein
MDVQCGQKNWSKWHGVKTLTLLSYRAASPGQAGVRCLDAANQEDALQ